MTCNIDSTPSKWEEFQLECQAFLNNRFEILALCEIKLEDSIATLYDVPKYVKFSRHVSLFKGGICMNASSLEPKYRPDIFLP